MILGSLEGIFKAHLVADRLRTEPVATGPATVVRQSEMYAAATGGPVLIGPVQSGFTLFSGPIDRTFKHYQLQGKILSNHLRQ